MKWTLKKPTQPGWYWYREVDGDEYLDPEICLVYNSSNTLRAMFIDGDIDLVACTSGEWFPEPIKEPQEHHDTRLIKKNN